MQTESSNVSGAQDPKPTAEVRKFMFDRSFDVVEPAKKKEVEAEAEAPAEEAEPEIVAPTFSEEEMNRVRDEAFAAGKEEGAGDARASTEREIKVALDGIVERLKGLGDAQDQANASVLETAVIVATGIARKLFPALNDKHALSEIERMVGLAMDRVLDEPKVVVYVNTALKAALAERVAGLVAKAKFKGEMIVEGVDDVIVGDCRVEWLGGGARRNMDELWHEVDEIVARNLADDSKTAAAVATETVDSEDESPTVDGHGGGAMVDGTRDGAEAAADDALGEAEAKTEPSADDAPPAPEAAADATGEAEAKTETDTETATEAATEATGESAPEAAPDEPDGAGDDTPTDREDR